MDWGYSAQSLFLIGIMSPKASPRQGSPRWSSKHEKRGRRALAPYPSLSPRIDRAPVIPRFGHDGCHGQRDRQEPLLRAIDRIVAWHKTLTSLEGAPSATPLRTDQGRAAMKWPPPQNRVTSGGRDASQAKRRHADENKGRGGRDCRHLGRGVGGAENRFLIGREGWGQLGR